MTDDEELKKVFDRYQKLLFKAANNTQEETLYGFAAEFSKKVDAANLNFKQLARRYVDKAIPDVNMSEDAQTTLKRAGAFHDTANVKLTTYVQMVSKLTDSAEQFKDRIQVRIDDDTKNGNITTVSDLKKYINDELKTGRGIAVTYSNGARMPTDKYAEMLARTTQMETQNIAMIGKALDDNNDLVECSTISPTCPTCAMYQGRIYSISGNTPGYPKLYETAFKNGYSCIHPNCRHQFFPYNPKFHTAEERERLEENTHKPFDGDPQSEAVRESYARSQMQMRQWNKELNEFAEMRARFGENAPYKDIGSFRRAYRSEEGSLPYAKTHYYRRDEKQFKEFYEVLGNTRMPKTLAKFQEMKYNKKDEFDLFVGFEKANEKQHISPLITFEVYKQVSKEIDEKLVGQTIGDITITGKVTHFIDRVIGEYQESDRKRKGERQGVPVDALRAIIDNNPPIVKKATNERGERSVSFDFGGCRITINPDNGLLIQTNKVK